MDPATSGSPATPMEHENMSKLKFSARPAKCLKWATVAFLIILIIVIAVAVVAYRTYSFQHAAVRSHQPQTETNDRTLPMQQQLRKQQKRIFIMMITVVLIMQLVSVPCTIIMIQSKVCFYHTTCTSGPMSTTAHPDREWMEITPELSSLYLIKYTTTSGETKAYRFIKENQSHCRKLGIHLGIDTPTIDDLYKRSESSEHFCDCIFSTWIGRGEDKYKVTWSGLLEVLEDAELGRARDNLKEALTLFYK